MKLALTVGLVTVVALAATGARAELPPGSGNQFMHTAPKETVYATEQHMGFSMRAAIIEWLGGVPVVKEKDLRASERQNWWGTDVRSAPVDVNSGGER